MKKSRFLHVVIMGLVIASLLVPYKGTAHAQSEDPDYEAAVWDSSTGVWTYRGSSGGTDYTAETNSDNSMHNFATLGEPGDIPVPADYVSDKLNPGVEVGIWRPADGNWHFYPDVYSSTPTIVQWGAQGDIPVPADYDGDNEAEIAIFRPSTGTWRISLDNQSYSSNGPSITAVVGQQGDIPVPADYDGDGEAEIAIYRPVDHIFCVALDNVNWGDGPVWVIDLGVANDIPVPGNYDSDDEIEMAVFHPADGMWTIAMNNEVGGNAPITQVQWGQQGDVPVPGFYARNTAGLSTQIAVWRSTTNTFYISVENESWDTTADINRVSIQMGDSNDEPVPQNYVDTNIM